MITILGLIFEKYFWIIRKFFKAISIKGGQDEICHNCTTGAYISHARRFCKLHDKTWDKKTNKCISKKKNKNSNKNKDVKKTSNKKKSRKK